MEKALREKIWKRGRQPSGGREPFIGIRLAPTLIERIDHWKRDHNSGSRSEAIRHVLEEGLKTRGY